MEQAPLLTIALLGAPHTGKSALAGSLNSAAKAGAWPVALTLAASLPALPATLPSYTLVLLTGLPTPPDSLRDSCQTAACRHLQEAADASIRSALAEAGVPYLVLYGRPEERLAQACAAIGHLLQPAQAGRPASQNDQPDQLPGSHRPWVWSCDKCSDPQCEHTLLTRLLARRSSSP